jgi:uncharacterized protein (DUF952 family)
LADKPRYTFHYTPAAHFAKFASGEDYTPPRYAEEGFIHCTDGAENMVQVVNRFYRDDPQDYLVLYIDKTRVKSSIKYEDPAEIYPHIYGPLNQDAIVDKRPALREPDGAFLPMPEFRSPTTTQSEYIMELAQHPERGQVVIVRITNKRSVSLAFQTEPLGDEESPLQPDASYDVVVQTPPNNYAVDIDIEDDGIRVWFTSPTASYGMVFPDVDLEKR